MHSTTSKHHHYVNWQYMGMLLICLSVPLILAHQDEPVNDWTKTGTIAAVVGAVVTIFAFWRTWYHYRHEKLPSVILRNDRVPEGPIRDAKKEMLRIAIKGVNGSQPVTIDRFWVETLTRKEANGFSWDKRVLAKDLSPYQKYDLPVGIITPHDGKHPLFVRGCIQLNGPHGKILRSFPVATKSLK